MNNNPNRLFIKKLLSRKTPPLLTDSNCENMQYLFSDRAEILFQIHTSEETDI